MTIYKTHSKFLLFREFFQPLFPMNQSSRDCMAGRGWCAMLHAWHGACVLSSYQKQLKRHSIVNIHMLETLFSLIYFLN